MGMEHHIAIIKDLRVWINANLHANLKINDVAERSGYSKYYIQRMFKNVAGQSIAEYIRNKKLEGARTDLAHSELRITDIALKYGFESHQIFCRIFKRRFTISPSLYRQQASNDTGRHPY